MNVSHDSIDLNDFGLWIAALAIAGACILWVLVAVRRRRQNVGEIIADGTALPSSASARPADTAPQGRLRMIAPETIRNSEASMTVHCSASETTIKELEQAFAQYERGRLSISSYCEVVELLVERLEARQALQAHMPDCQTDDDLAHAIEAARWCLEWGQAQIDGPVEGVIAEN